MGVVDEKDYIMRMIKEMVQVLFSLVFGKKYVSVELEDENKYEVSGNTLKYFFDMIDQGDINEAENLLLKISIIQIKKKCFLGLSSYLKNPDIRT